MKTLTRIFCITAIALSTSALAYDRESQDTLDQFFAEMQAHEQKSDNHVAVPLCMIKKSQLDVSVREQGGDYTLLVEDEIEVPITEALMVRNLFKGTSFLRLKSNALKDVNCVALNGLRTR